MALAGAGCAGGSDEGAGAGDGGPAEGEEIDVVEASSAPDGAKVRVRGALVARPNEVRLCERLVGSSPRQCAGQHLRLRVRGAILSGLDIQTGGGVGTAEDVVLEGTLRDGVLFVSGRG